MKYIESQSDGEIWMFLAGLVVFVGMVGYFGMWQIRYIKLVQRIYPDKKGDPTSINFRSSGLQAVTKQRRKKFTKQAIRLIC